MLRKLPCGGHVTSSFGNEEPQQFRITRAISDNARKALFVLARPFAVRGDNPGIEESWCTKFCEQNGYGELCLLYLLPHIVNSTDDLKYNIAPWGPGPTNARIQDIEISHTHGGIVVAAWGDEGAYRGADTKFISRFDGSPRPGTWQRASVTPIYVLGLTPAGNPVTVLGANGDASLRLHPKFDRDAA